MTARQVPFRPHGDVRVFLDAGIAHVWAEGPFNVEAVDLFSRRMQSVYRSLKPGQRVVNITEVVGSLVATPEAWSMMEGHLQRVNESGLDLRGTACVVAHEVEGRSLFVPRAERAFRMAGRVFKVFESMPPAEAWATELLGRG